MTQFEIEQHIQKHTYSWPLPIPQVFPNPEYIYITDQSMLGGAVH